MAEIRARDLYRLIQFARFPSTGFLVSGLGQLLVNASNKLLHLGRHQACSTLVSQQSFLDGIDAGMGTLLISSGRAVAWPTRRAVIKLVLNSPLGSLKEF
jgi:hypothetical protein